MNREKIQRELQKFEERVTEIKREPHECKENYENVKRIMKM